MAYRQTNGAHRPADLWPVADARKSEGGRRVPCLLVGSLADAVTVLVRRRLAERSRFRIQCRGQSRHYAVRSCVPFGDGLFKIAGRPDLVDLCDRDVDKLFTGLRAGYRRLPGAWPGVA